MKRMMLAMALMVALFLIAAGPAGASVQKEKPRDNPAAEGAKTAAGLVESATKNTVNLMRQGLEKTVDGTRKAANQVNTGVQKGVKKTVEAGRTTYQAVTDDKVQAGVTGGLVVGVPAGGAAYLIAAAAGAGDPVSIGIIVSGVIGGIAAYQTAETYDKTHPEK